MFIRLSFYTLILFYHFLLFFKCLITLKNVSVLCQSLSSINHCISLQPPKLLLQHAYSLQKLLPVLLGSELCLLLHLHNLPLVPTLQLSRHRLKKTLSHLIERQQHIWSGSFKIFSTKETTLWKWFWRNSVPKGIVKHFVKYAYFFFFLIARWEDISLIRRQLA